MDSSVDPTAAAARDFGAGSDADFDYPDADAVVDEFDLAEDHPDEEDYYVLLGLVPYPPPTEIEIRRAYRNMSFRFHPDRVPPHLRETTTRRLNLIQKAHETLVDPQKRAVYDILGAEGVRREWGPFGSMGRANTAERKEVGVKAMSPDEFRQWFLKTMKKREHQAVENLVASRGNLTLGIDASNTLSYTEDEEVVISVPSPKLKSFGVAHSFKTYLPVPDFLIAARNDDETQGEDTRPHQNEFDEKPEHIPLTFDMGIAGPLAYPVKKFRIQGEEESDEEIIVPHPPIVPAQSINLGVTATPNLRTVADALGIWNSHPLSLLKDSGLAVKAVFLPVPMMSITLARLCQPIPGTKPFNVTASTLINRSLWKSLPSCQVQVTREIAERKLLALAWSSGLLEWPESLSERLSSLGMDTASYYIALQDVSSLQIGVISTPKSTGQVVDIDDDEDDEEEEDDVPKLLKGRKSFDRLAEAWQAFVQVSPGGGAFRLTYALDVFSGTPANDPVRTEWSNDGYAPMPKMEGPRAVRVEISSLLGFDGSLGWSVKGTRRVGEYTRMGVGVGYSESGITMTVSWKRLGQGITIPIALCPPDESTHDAALLATLLPWLAYGALEYAYIRPRDRKRRRQAAARRHRELMAQVPEKRDESVQAILMMTADVMQQQEEEEKRFGLVIVKAEYGYFPSETKKPKHGLKEPRVVDVTIPVAGRVHDGQLVIEQGMVLFQIPGFYDPAPLLPKRLKVWYLFHGRPHFVEVGDKEGIACSRATHQTLEEATCTCNMSAL